jgi:Fur family ferric uptake transcriptional regulator
LNRFDFVFLHVSCVEMANRKSGLSVEQLKELIRGSGLRATPARIAVLQYLSDAKRPITHAELVEQLGDNGTDASTLFRALNDMAESQLLRRMELGDHVWRYEMIDQTADHQPHAHFLCVDCGEITCLHGNDSYVSQISRTKTKIGAVTEVLLKGHCSDCQ